MSIEIPAQRLKIFTPDIGDLEKIRILARTSGLLIEEVTEGQFYETFRWLYFDDNYCDDISKLRVGLSDRLGKVVGFYGGVPFDFQINNRKVCAALASNLVISPDNRAGGTAFYNLQKAFIKGYREIGYEFAYGLITRKGVLDIHLRMGWKGIGEMPVYVRPINFIKILSKSINIKPIKYALYIPAVIINLILKIINIKVKEDIRVQRIFSFDQKFNDFLNDWNSLNEISSIRSVEGLNWRYCRRVERGYQIYCAQSENEIIGYAVIRPMKMKKYQVLALVDLVVKKNNGKIVNTLLKKVVNIASNTEVDMIASALLPHDPILKYFFRNGFFKSPEKFTLVAHFSKDKNAIYKDFEKWRINWFDHDYV